MVYVPAVFTSTVSPETTMLVVISPSTLSVAVAPGSVNASPRVTLIVSLPVNVITGATISAATITVLVTSDAALPVSSLTL